ncbi:MAG: hypothetical protein J6A01_10565 [Proteobacteria bacterium]|nr:hypothetical protein [Pseudomonadota bacterium]
MKNYLLSLVFALIPLAAHAEDVVLYSYAKTMQKPAEWAVMPLIADLPDSHDVTLFEALKRKKLPTYGSTSFLPDKKQVLIDATKCAYGSIISAEVSSTFKAHGHGIPSFVCDNRPVAAADEALMHYMAIVPMWQALGAKSVDEPALIQMGDSYLLPKAFYELLKKQDKSLIKSIEADFDNPNIFVKTGAMKGYIAHKFPGAEKRVAKELTSKTPGNVNAAMTALADTRDAATISQMKAVLSQTDAMQEVYALAMLDAADRTLYDDALLILLKSSNDANFERALAEVDKSGKSGVMSVHLAEILNASTPAHGGKIAQRLVKLDESGLLGWLAQCSNSETSQSVASTVLNTSNTAALRNAAWAVQLENPSPDNAFDALDTLMKQGELSPEYWLRGLRSPHLAVQFLAAEQIEQSKSAPADLSAFVENASKIENYYPVMTAYLANHAAVESLKSQKDAFAKRSVDMAAALEKAPTGKPNGAQLLALAQKTPADSVAPLTSEAYNSQAGMRRDVAYATRWIDTSGDALRVIMLKDSDETVAQTLIAQISKRPPDEISLALVKDITARAERSANLKIAALHALPFVMNEKTIQTISTYASNEMFDNDINVKIAAIRALSNIAQKTKDPVIADNAITSLALTAQDKSPSIVHHTLMALAKTHAPAAREIIERAKSTHPESAKRALEFF